MNAQSRDTVTFLLSTITGLLVLIGLAVRFVLLPWLRDHLVQPVQETHRQISENGHVDADAPTIPDRLQDLAAAVHDATEDHAVLSRDLAAMTRVLDQHLTWADRYTDLVDRELQLVKDQLAAKQATENGDKT